MDTDARYAVKGWAGIAFRIDGPTLRWEPYTSLAECEDLWCDCHHGGDLHEVELDEGEWEEDPESGRVIVVMVGDDKRHEVDLSDLTKLDDGAYCESCGQIGCGHGRA